ncbi:MAG: response regulator [Pirellulales bacterium]|nr:response regulator [Planctomycetales bacterium]
MAGQMWAYAARYGFAILATMVATWVRLSLSEILEDRMPYGLYFVSVILTVWVAGVGPALLSFILGIFAAVIWIIPPHNSMAISHPADQISLGIFIVVGGAAIIIYRLADRKQLAINLQAEANARLTEQLQDADRRKDNWLALLAHELRNPLTPLRSGIDLLDREPDDADQMRRIRLTMRRQTEQLVRIVEDLLDVSRYTRGQLRLAREPVDLRMIVQQAVEMTLPLLVEQNHELKHLSYGEPLMVNGDATRLVQVVANLLSNAAKYTPRSGRIQVLMDGDGELARVCIVDNGIGIAKGMQEGVFELFAQADSPRSRDRQGLGIGLALVKSLVEMHDGFVTLHSDGPGRGSRFSITLPRLPASSDENTTTPTESRSGLQGIAGKSLLLIDDNEDAVRMLQSLLTLDGVEVSTAFDGASGLEIVGNVRPDFVLLDIGMPGMDGYEVVERIRRCPSLPQPIVIAVSGWGSDADRRRSINAGFDDHLVKPVDYDELMNLLRIWSQRDIGGRRPNDADANSLVSNDRDRASHYS